jgi:hypothetical protein
MPAVAYERLRDLLASDPTGISKSLSDVAKETWNRISNTNTNDLDALGDSIDQTTRTTGIPQLALLPMALKSPKVLALLSKRLGVDLAKGIDVARHQRELTLAESNPARGAWFFGPLRDVLKSGAYHNLGQFSTEGGPNLVTDVVEAKNPFVVPSGFSALSDALNPLIGQGRWREEAKKLPNNVIRQIQSHLASLPDDVGYVSKVTNEQVLKERLAAEILKRQGYDSVLSSHSGGMNEIVKLRNTKGTHVRPETPEQVSANLNAVRQKLAQQKLLDAQNSNIWKGEITKVEPIISDTFENVKHIDSITKNITNFESLSDSAKFDRIAHELHNKFDLGNISWNEWNSAYNQLKKMY